jgi:hypothetical protein
MDINAIKQRLNSLQNTSKKTDALWKPKPGKYVLRIVPYKFNKQNPFIELLFHYNINNKTYLSPASFGRPDPILEFAEKLKRLGDTENWKAGKKMEPKLRTFAPVVIRGQENEGVKFWGFGKTVYQEILAIIADPDYGDITDENEGRDVVIEIVEEAGKTYPETRIRVKPNVTKLTENSELENKLLNEQTEITDIYSELSYAELKGVLENWLNPTASHEDDDSPAPSVASETLAPKPQSVQEQVAPQPVAVPKSKEPITELPWDVAEEKPASTKVDVASAFEDLFNS